MKRSTLSSFPYREAPALYGPKRPESMLRGTEEKQRKVASESEMRTAAPRLISFSRSGRVTGPMRTN